MRLLAGALAGQVSGVALTGDAQLLARPMARVVDPLSDMGAHIFCGPEGRPPVILARESELIGIDAHPPVASAQVTSAILLAGLRASGTTSITEPGPTRDHTERMLAALGADLRRDGSRVSIRASQLSGADFVIPGDPSSAAVAVALATLVEGSDLTVADVGLNPTRLGYVRALRRMGAEIELGEQSIHLNEPVGRMRVRCSDLTGIDLTAEDVADCIDEAPLLMLCATQARGATTLSGLAELRVKESDRVAATVAGLRALGARIEDSGDSVRIDGPTPLVASSVNACEDHRIAMMLTVAACCATGGPTTVVGGSWVSDSFPDFERWFDELTGGDGPDGA